MAPYNSGSSHGSTKVAIAWLSDLKGEVQLADIDGGEFHPAIAHTPVAEGNVIQTAAGRVEIEFEDTSTVRLGPFSSIEITRSELFASGMMATTVSVLKGTVYASVIPAYIVKPREKDLQLRFDRQVLHLQPSSHVRLELDATRASLAILDGTGSVDGPFGTIRLVKKRTFVFSFAGQSEPTVVNKVNVNALDTWDRSAVTAHQTKGEPEKKNSPTLDHRQQNPWCNLFQCAPA